MDGVAGDGLSAARITWRDLMAWCALTDSSLAPWEARCLVRIGAKGAEIAGEELERKRREAQQA